MQRPRGQQAIALSCLAFSQAGAGGGEEGVGRRTSASAGHRRRTELREDRRPSSAQNAGGKYAQAQPRKPDEGQ